MIKQIASLFSGFGWSLLSDAGIAISGWLSRSSSFKFDPTESSSFGSSFVTKTRLAMNVVAGRSYVGRVVLFFSAGTASHGFKCDFFGGTVTASTFAAAIVSRTEGDTIGASRVTDTAGLMNITAFGVGDMHAIELNFYLEAATTGTLIPRMAKNSGIGFWEEPTGSYCEIEEVS